MFITELTKAYQFAWEAWKFTWKNLKIGLCFVLLPCIVNIFCIKYFDITQSNNPIMYFGLTDLLMPLWAVGWLKYILTQKPFSLKSYFTLDRTYLMILFYAFIVSMPLYCYEYLNHLGSFNPLKDILEMKIGIPLQMDQVLLKYYGVGLISLILLSMVFLPMYFVFPSIVDKKPFLLLKSWERIKSFYLNYCLSYVMLVLALSIFAAGVLLISQLVVWYLVSIGDIYHLEFITKWPVWSFLGNREMLSVMWYYLVSLFFFSLIAFYYKRFLTVKSKSVKSKARPKKVASSDTNSAATVPVHQPPAF